LLSRGGKIPAKGKVSAEVTHGHDLEGVVASVRLSCASGTPKPLLTTVVTKSGKTSSHTTLGDLRAPLVPRA
jgi:hypothetical protein